MNHCQLAETIIRVSRRCPRCRAAANSRDDAEQFLHDWTALGDMPRISIHEPDTAASKAQAHRDRRREANKGRTADWYQVSVSAWLTEHGEGTCQQIADGIDTSLEWTRKQLARMRERQVLESRKGRNCAVYYRLA